MAWTYSEVGLSISASSGAPTWENVSTGLGKSSSFGGGGVAKTTGSSLFGVELPDACPEVSGWELSDCQASDSGRDVIMGDLTSIEPHWVDGLGTQAEDLVDF